MRDGTLHPVSVNKQETQFRFFFHGYSSIHFKSSSIICCYGGSFARNKATAHNPIFASQKKNVLPGGVGQLCQPFVCRKGTRVGARQRLLQRGRIRKNKVREREKGVTGAAQHWHRRLRLFRRRVEPASTLLEHTHSLTNAHMHIHTPSQPGCCLM